MDSYKCYKEEMIRPDESYSAGGVTVWCNYVVDDSHANIQISLPWGVSVAGFDALEDNTYTYYNPNNGNEVCDITLTAIIWGLNNIIQVKICIGDTSPQQTTTTVSVNKSGNVDIVGVMYYQSGMGNWAYIPSNNTIPYGETWFSVSWKSTAEGNVCCKVNLKVNGMTATSGETETKCVNGLGNGQSRGFDSFAAASSYSLQVTLVGSGGGTPTATPTPSSCHVDKVISKTGNVDYVEMSYYQVGMSKWELLPSNGNIGYGTTWFAVAWKSTANGHVCCKVYLRNYGTLVDSNDTLEKCADGLGNGNSRGFEPLAAASTYNLGIQLEGSGGTTVTPTPSSCHVDKVISKSGNVDYVEMSYYQVGMSKWELLPSNGNIGYGTTWFAVAWKSTANGHVCCKVYLRNFGTLVDSNDTLEKCADGLGNGNSRGFEPLAAASTYNLGIQLVGSGGTTITPTPSSCHVDKVISRTGNVEYVEMSYYQVGMSKWELLPSNGNIGYGTTWFAVAWRSTAEGHVCCKVYLRNYGTLVDSNDTLEKCADGLGNGQSRGFEPLAAASTYNLGIQLEGSGGTTVTPTPSSCHVDKVISKSGNVDYVEMSYYQVGMSKWELLPSNGNIGYGTTWFAVAWKSTAEGHVCCKVYLRNFGTLVDSKDTLEKCADGLGNGQSRGFEPLAAASTYNLGIQLVGSGGTTVTPTPSTSHVDKVISKSGNVDFLQMSYYQVGLTQWELLPSNGNIGYGTTWFAVAWKSTAEGHVCCKVYLRNFGTLVDSKDTLEKCADGLGNGNSRGFEPLAAASTYNLGIQLEGTGGTTITPTPSSCHVDKVISKTGNVDYVEMSYYQVGMSKWELLPSNGNIGYGTTWFAVAWKSTAEGHVCCKVYLRNFGTLVDSNDVLEKCADGLGNGQSRGFEPLAAASSYNLGIQLEGTGGTTVTPTPTSSHVDKVISKTGNVDLFEMSYYQVGLTQWTLLPSNGNIGYGTTWFAVAWKSTAEGHVCCKVSLRNYGTLVDSKDVLEKCVDGLGNGQSRGFEPLAAASTYNLGIQLEGSGGTTITPAPSYIQIYQTFNVTGPVKFLDMSYFQIGMTQWELIPTDKRIPYNYTWFAIAWVSTVDANVCSSVELKINDENVLSNDELTKCATGLGNGNSRGFEPFHESNTYNMVVTIKGTSSITPTPQTCTVNVVTSATGFVELVQVLYYQANDTSWKSIPANKLIPYGITWFAVSWRSTSDGHVCCKTNLRLDGALISSGDPLETCVDTKGAGGSRGFDQVPARSSYNLGVELVSTGGSTITPVPTESKIAYIVNDAPGVELLYLKYWQQGMTAWKDVPKTENIPYKKTTLAVTWRSTVADPICVKTKMIVTDINVGSSDAEQKCTTGIGTGQSRVFDELPLLEYINIRITFESDFTPITGDHYKVTVSNIPSEGIKVDCFKMETLLGVDECLYGWCGTQHIADKDIKAPVPTSTTLIFSEADGLKAGNKYAFNPRYTFMDILRGLVIPRSRFTTMVEGENNVVINGYYPPAPWQTEICNTFDVSEKDCVQSFYRLGVDFFYSADSWSKAIYGKDLEGNPASANKWDYLFMFLDIIPVVGKIKYVGRLKITALGNDLAKVDKELGGGKVLTWIDDIGKAELIVAISRMEGKEYVEMIDLLRDGNMAGAKHLVLNKINTDVVSGSTDVLKIAGDQLVDAADNVVSKAAKVAEEVGYDFAFSDVILKEASLHTTSLSGMQNFLISNAVMDEPGLMFHLIKNGFNKFDRIIPGTESMAKGGISMSDVYWLEALNTPGHAKILKSEGYLDEFVDLFNAWYAKDPQKVRKLIALYPQSDVDRMAAEMASYGYKGSSIYYGVAKAVDNGVKNGGILNTIDNVVEEVGQHTDYIKPHLDDIIDDIVENVPPSSTEVQKVGDELAAKESAASKLGGPFRALWNIIKEGISKKMGKDWDKLSNTEKVVGYIKWTFVGCFLLFIIEEALQLITFSFIPIQSQTYSWEKKTQQEKDDIIDFYQDNIDWAKSQVSGLTSMQAVISLTCLPFAPVYWKIIEGVNRYLVNQQWTVDQLTADRNPLGGWDASLRISCNVDGVDIDINGAPKSKQGRKYAQDYAVVISDQKEITEFVVIGRKEGYVQDRAIVEMSATDAGEYKTVYLELQPEPNLEGMPDPKTSTSSKMAALGVDESDLPESMGGTKDDGEWWSGETVGSIEVKSDPYGAYIYLDGINQNKTTTSLITSPIGSHVVTCKKAGYKDGSETVLVEANKVKDVMITLLKEADGLIKCFCVGDEFCEAGADIFIDGQPTGEKTTNKPFSRNIPVPSGNRTVKYDLYGIMACNGSVTVPENGEASFECTLKGVLDPDQTGIVTTVTKIIDGNTIETEYTKNLPITKVRIVGYNSPEIGTAKGTEVIEKLNELIPVGSQIKLRVWNEKPLLNVNMIYGGVFKQDGTDVALEIIKTCLVKVINYYDRIEFPWVDWDVYVNEECETGPGGEKLGSVEVKSDPTNAYIYVDGIPQDKVTTSTISISEGEHVITCKKVGYQDTSETVIVETGITKSILITLPYNADGIIKCFCTDDEFCPRGADILVDGVATGYKTTNKPFSVDIHVPSGEHVVSYDLYNVMGCEGTVTVPSGGTTSFDGQLEGLLDPDQTGVDTTVTEIIDGDTIVTAYTQNLPIPSVRMTGYDAPESNTAAGTIATEKLSQLIPVGSSIRLRVWKYLPLGLFNRVLGGVFKPDGTDVSLEMLRSCLVELAPSSYQDKFPWIDWNTYKIAQCDPGYTGDLTITCYSAYGIEEKSATIFVDGLDKGYAPITIKDLIEGSHTVRVEKTGFNACKWCSSSPGCADFGPTRGPCSFEVYIYRDMVTSLSIILESINQWEFNFESEPYNASISIDGQVIK